MLQFKTSFAVILWILVHVVDSLIYANNNNYAGNIINHKLGDFAKAVYDKNTSNLLIDSGIPAEVKPVCIQQKCSLRTYPECKIYGDNIFKKTEEICQIQKKDENYVIFENLNEGKYFIQNFENSNSKYYFCLYRSPNSNVSQWNARMDLKYIKNGSRKLSLVMEEDTQMRLQFNFSKFLIELVNFNGNVINYTVLQYNPNNFRLEFDFENITEGSYSAKVTPVDCRCTNPDDTSSVPCKRQSNSVDVTNEIVQSSKEQLDNNYSIWYSVLGLTIFTIIITIVVYAAKKTFSIRRKMQLQNHQDCEVPLQLDSSNYRPETPEIASPDSSLLLLYLPEDLHIKEHLLEFLKKLEINFPGKVHDFGNQKEQNSLHEEGSHWFASRLRHNTKVIVVASNGMKKLEDSLIVCNDISLQNDINLLCLAGFNIVLSLIPVQERYNRIFCVKFDGMNEDYDCRLLVPLQRFHLPQHEDLLFRHLLTQ